MKLCLMFLFLLPFYSLYFKQLELLKMRSRCWNVPLMIMKPQTSIFLSLFWITLP